jgi:transcriptional regulator with XRE-family HTH domain
MERVKMDYALLIGKIKDKYQTHGQFAKKMGISKSGLSAKLNNRRDFTSDEIVKACKLLKISVADIPLYFFQEKVA